eukprot:15464494-Alexandrium_andersonii.AAC.1
MEMHATHFGVARKLCRGQLRCALSGARAAVVQARRKPSWADSCCGAVGPSRAPGTLQDRDCAATADTLETPFGISVPHRCGHPWNYPEFRHRPKGALRCGWVGNTIPGDTSGLNP